MAQATGSAGPSGGAGGAPSLASAASPAGVFPASSPPRAACAGGADGRYGRYGRMTRRQRRARVRRRRRHGLPRLQRRLVRRRRAGEQGARLRRLRLLAADAHRGHRLSVRRVHQRLHRMELGVGVRPAFSVKLLGILRAVVLVQPPRLDQHRIFVQELLAHRQGRADLLGVGPHHEPALLLGEAELRVRLHPRAPLSTAVEDRHRLLVRPEDILAEELRRPAGEVHVRLEPQQIHVDAREPRRVAGPFEVLVDPGVEVEARLLEGGDLVARGRATDQIDHRHAEVLVVVERAHRRARMRAEHDLRRRARARLVVDERDHHRRGEESKRDRASEGVHEGEGTTSAPWPAFIKDRSRQRAHVVCSPTCARSM